MFASFSVASFGQGIVKGIVWDDDMNEPMIGANVIVRGTTIGLTTDFDGNFELNAPAGNQTIQITFVGYSTKDFKVNVVEGQTIDLGRIEMKLDAVGLQEVQLIANVAIDRKTPVAVSTVSPLEIEEKLGSQEYPEILKTTPGVYATKSGGGFGDSRINIRGFDMRNTAVLINGIPVNDMENGWVYWSNWAGLSEVTRSMQVQRGLGASKLSIGSVGGTINVITKTTDAKKGGNAYYGIGNDGRVKKSITLSSGLTEDNWAFTFSGAHTSGNGWADGLWFEGWSYFMNISKSLGDHTFSFSIFGAPQEHGQRRTKLEIEDWNDPNKGIKYNPDWGYKGGEFVSLNKNFYHKPQISLNHYWKMGENTMLSSSAYVSFGTGGGTGNYGEGKFFDENYKIDGQINFDKIVEENIAAGNAGSSSILRSSNNNHNWYGLLSNIQHNFGENLEVSGGLDVRYYKGEHYREVTDLLGGNFYLESISQRNLDGSSAGRKEYIARVGDKIAYNNDGEVRWAGLFAQAEYTLGDLSAFASAAVNQQGSRRTDYFTYASGTEQTDWVNHLGYIFKGGANYNLNENHNVFVNAGYFERTPFFDAIFINFRNDINEGAVNEKTLGFEAGYGFRNAVLSANVNAYHTQWKDKYLRRSYQTPAGDFFQANLTGVNATHMGVEGDATYRPTKRLSINGSVSIGNWIWDNDIENVVITDDNQIPLDTLNIKMKGVKVGDAAQTTASIGFSYEIISGLKIGADYIYQDNLYAQFDPISSNGENSWKLPAIQLVDFRVVYNFEIGDLDATIFANVNNLLDTKYISDADDGASHDWDTARVFYGFGRTWSSGIKVNF